MRHVCENCHHWHPEDYGEDKDFGECRKRAPVINGDDTCAHPVSPAYHTCGEFEVTRKELN